MLLSDVTRPIFPTRGDDTPKLVSAGACFGLRPDQTSKLAPVITGRRMSSGEAYAPREVDEHYSRQDFGKTIQAAAVQTWQIRPDVSKILLVQLRRPSATRGFYISVTNRDDLEAFTTAEFVEGRLSRSDTDWLFNLPNRLNEKFQAFKYEFTHPT